MLVALQLLGCAAVPLKLTTLVPWVDPKLLPEIMTDVPTAPETGFTPAIVGPEALSPPVPSSSMPTGVAIMLV
jgi:hypothetical protein